MKSIVKPRWQPLLGWAVLILVGLFATEDDVAQGSGSETKGLTLTGRGNLDVEVGPVLTTGATIRALQASLLQQDAGAEQLTAANSDESEWHALIDVSPAGKV